MALTLDQAIVECARETQLRIGASTAGPACQALAALLAGDPTSAAAAQQMIEDGASLESRDAITRWRSALLRASLPPPGA